MFDTTLIQNVIDSLRRIPFSWIIVLACQEIFISIMSTGPVPKHIGLIMDGNRRFAKKRDISLAAGHAAGATSLLSVLETCFRVGVTNITIYAFSIENFHRSPDEVNTLLELLRDRLTFLSQYDESFARLNQIRIKIIGNVPMIPPDIMRDLRKVEELTDFANATRYLNVCFPYTSRDDITSSVRKICQQREESGFPKEAIDEQMLTHNMYMGSKTPQLDLLIRTSGHNRLSDFMLWQCTENCMIEFIDTLWPDFKFFAMFLVLLKWSFYKQREIDHRIALGKTNAEPSSIALSSLPPAPPFASIAPQ